MTAPQLLAGALQGYDWGSETFIPEFLGRPGDGTPVAEVWFGAHPLAPALVGPERRPLDAVIAADPAGELGADVAARYGELPFLVKVLAATSPLSLQVHPTAAQAAEGFAREERRGIPRSSAQRSFRDPHHKPELICALTDFEALCGFRDPATTLALYDRLAVVELAPVARMLAADPTAAGLAEVVAWLLHLGPADAAPMVAALAAADTASAADDPDTRLRAVLASLARRFPADAGVVVATLLELVTLRPGDGLHLGAGRLHSYLRGAAVEVMASSDNVVRGGLTSKHVDVDTLLELVDTTPTPVAVSTPVVEGGVARYPSPPPSSRRCASTSTVPSRSIRVPPSWCASRAGARPPGSCSSGVGLVDPARAGSIVVDGRATLHLTRVP
ncbi:MAG: mannose-6-phosphate isomerase, class I [Acidimicrobiales bacterium]